MLPLLSVAARASVSSTLNGRRQASANERTLDASDHTTQKRMNWFLVMLLYSSACSLSDVSDEGWNKLRTIIVS